MGGGGGYTIHLSYGWVVEEVIRPVEEVIHFCGGGYTPCGGGYYTLVILVSDLDNFLKLRPIEFVAALHMV